MDTIAIRHAGETVALAGRERFWLAAHIEALPDGNLRKRPVCFMAVYAATCSPASCPACTPTATPTDSPDSSPMPEIRRLAAANKTDRTLAAARPRNAGPIGPGP